MKGRRTSRRDPTGRELAAWRRLIREARAVSLDPFRQAGDLAVAVTASKRASFPRGADALFADLHAKARGFGLVIVADRRAPATELGILAGRCAAFLDAPPPEPVTPRRRADIDD